MIFLSINLGNTIQRRVQNPVKHLRWSVLGKQLRGFSRLLFLQSTPSLIFDSFLPRLLPLPGFDRFWDRFQDHVFKDIVDHHRTFYEICSLAHFMSLTPFSTSWQQQKKSGFLMFSGGIERGQWHEMSFVYNYVSKHPWK